MMNKTKTIKIDWDFKVECLVRNYTEILVETLKSLRMHGENGISSATVKETNKGFHIKIKLENDIYEVEAIAIAIVCASDINREIFNLQRLLMTNTSQNILADKKHEYIITSFGAECVNEGRERDTQASYEIQEYIRSELLE